MRLDETDVIILNGASSSGKSTLARALQVRLFDQTWFHVSFDTWIAGCRPRRHRDPSEEEARAMVEGFHAAVLAFVQRGNRVILDSVISTDESLAHLRDALEGLRLLWVRLDCDGEELDRREMIRGDRDIGVARVQGRRIAAGSWDYDVSIDTTQIAAWDAATTIIGAAVARSRQEQQMVDE
jgi:chloramphenicol 3-O phosphotransferase